MRKPENFPHVASVMEEEREKRVYLNQAATSYPKPDCAVEAAVKTIRGLPSGQHRDGSGENTGDVFSECRTRLGRLLGIGDTERIRFTSGATESMNLLLSGLQLPAGRIITTVTEHNSVLRPLYNLPGIAGKPRLLPCDQNGYTAPELLEKEAANGGAGAVILNHCSNVTGALQNAEAFGEIAKKYGLLFILDLSQSAGHLPVNTDAWKADAVVFTGHKGLLGLQGTGGFYIREGVPYRPARYGGTGRGSERLIFDPEEPDQEPGTQNMPGIAALSASSGWILQEGIERIRQKELLLTERAYAELETIPRLRICGGFTESRGPVVSFRPEGMDPADLGYILGSSYGIITRAGLHCSPLIHPYINSDQRGTVRISFSVFNTTEDIQILADALREIL